MPETSNPAIGLTCVYDAWNRLVEVKQGSTPVATYTYDGLGRRITETAGDTQTYYYSSSDQVLEQLDGSNASADCQYVWGLRYVHDLVLRDSGAGFNVRLYALQDANWNVVALVGNTGTWQVVERFIYTPYGTATPLSVNFATYGGTNYNWTTLFAGRDFDTATGLYYNRAGSTTQHWGHLST